VVPVGRPVRLNLKSDDVIHSFWVPQLAGKQDAEPGWRYGGWQQPFIWFVADRPGVYEGQCAELCGTQHAVDGQRQPAKEPAAGSAEARGLALITDPKNKCLACHQIYGVKNMLGQTGPNLTHMASRELLAGGVFTNTPENLHQWIKNPDSLKFGSKMVLTDVNLTDAQIADRRHRGLPRVTRVGSQETSAWQHTSEPCPGPGRAAGRRAS
jgi:cytochrome c oxidase subunit 2